MNTFRNVERLQMVGEMNKRMQVFNRKVEYKNYINKDDISLNDDKELWYYITNETVL